MSAVRTPLHHALALSHEMVGAAHAADWDKLDQLEAQRHPQVMQLHPPGPDTLHQLREILECDRQLAMLVVAAREAAAERWKRESGRAQAIAAYAL